MDAEGKEEGIICEGDDDDDDVAEVVFMIVASSLLTPHPRPRKFEMVHIIPQLSISSCFTLIILLRLIFRAHSPDAGSIKKLSLRLINPITRMVISWSIFLPYVSLNPANQMSECLLVDNDSPSPSSHI